MSTRPKILLVDDREENLLALRALLEHHDADFLEARSGEEALELLLQHEVALALVDVQMPEMSGFELAELMRGSERTREIPIIFITAGAHDYSRIFQGYESGAVDFLVKPLEPHIVNSKVAVFLQLYCQKRQLADRVAELEQAQGELRRAKEGLELADRRKNDFLAILSHELRNPLSPIKNSLYILDRSAPGEEQARRAKEIMERQVDQLSRLIDDLLDVTRVTRNKIVLQREHLDLTRLVRKATDDYRSLFEKGGVTLDLRLASEEIFVHGDAARLAQVVSNLVQNAVKFTRAGGWVRVSVERADDERNALVRVCDSGIGMRPETRDSLFEPFVQAESTLDRSKGGLGLGLALVKGLVELHGGEVSAHSEGIGRGSEFTVRLPLVAASAPSKEEDMEQRSGKERFRVLVIEDNVDSADSLRDVLELTGHEVEVAYAGQEGLEKARAWRPDLIICDIGLPGMDGYEVARAIRADEALKGTCLVALSGYTLSEDIERATAAGFERHLAKPANLKEIEKLLTSLMERS